MLSFKVLLMIGFVAGVLVVEWYQNFYILYGAILIFAIFTAFEDFLRSYVETHLLLRSPKEDAARVEHDKRRRMTYPDPIFNTWYHLCDSEELQGDRVVEVRALGQVFALWRTSEGKPVCQDAYCLHLGANLAVGGKVVDNCITCPFHKWKFDEKGEVKEIPYLPEPHKCHTQKKLKTYHCRDFCGLVMIYFHADDKEPEFSLPLFLEEDIKREGFKRHLKWDIGFKTLSPVDWVDQSGDHAHFNTLHSEFLIPWTTVPIPQWLLKIFPLGITHQLVTYLGDDLDWKERVERTTWGLVDKHYIFFSDRAGLTWDGKPMETTIAETMEMFVGPALMVFNIPFTIGAFKVFVSTTPTEGGSMMKVRTMVDRRVWASIWVRMIAWVLQGISASQLNSDIDIMCNKIRMKKPILVPFDGPYNRTNRWSRQFYSEGTTKVNSCDAYKNDW
jgi:cholesterol 7-dehydrogenase